MKILNLYFKNINSLGGENRVHFDQTPFADGSVFAITGPNGSGKTSILDAITLALYGETFRFDKPAEHVMTQHTTESFAQVEFQLGGERFRSSWQVKRQDDTAQSALLPPQMQLIKVNGQEQILGDNATQVRHKIIELTGMDFHKFTKSMVLSQGDFAAFLNALDSERLDILEKISGGDLLAEHKQQIQTNHDLAQAALKQLQQDLSLIPLLDTNSLEARTQDLEDFQQQASEFKTEQREIVKQLHLIQNHAAIAQKIKKLQTAETTLSERITLHEQNLITIADSQPALVFKDELAVLDSKTEQLRQNQVTLNNYRREAVSLQNQLNGAGQQFAALSHESIAQQRRKLDDLKLNLSELRLALPREAQLLESCQLELAEKAAALDAVDTWLSEYQGDACLVDDFPDTAKLKAVRQELQRISGQYKTHANWAKSIQNAIKKNQTSIKNLESHIVELKQRAAQTQHTFDELSRGQTLEQLTELRNEQQERMWEFRELHDLAVVCHKLGKRGFFGFFARRRAQHDELDEQRLVSRAETLRMELNKEENIRDVIEELIAHDVLIKRLQTERSKLQDGKPCPLCGALEHPFAKKPPQPVADRKQALLDQRVKIRALRVAMDNVTRQLKELQQQNLHRHERDLSLQQLRAQWQTLANRLNALSDGMTIDDLSAQKQRLSEEKEELDKLDSLLKKCTQLQKQAQAFNQDIANKEKKLLELKTELQEFETEWQNRPQDQIDLEQAFAKAEAEEKALLPKVEQQLAKLGEKVPKFGKEDALFDVLNPRRQAYQSALMRQKLLQEEVEKLRTDLQSHQTNVENFNQRITEQQAQLQTAELASLHLALVEKQKLIAAKEPELTAQEQELNALNQVLLQKLVAQPFNTLDALHTVLKLIADEAMTRQQLGEDQQRLTELWAQIQQQIALLEQAQATLPAMSEEALKQQQRGIEEKLSIAEQEVQTLESQLQKQQTYQQRYEQLTAQLEAQHAVAKACERDLQLLKTDSHQQLRRHIQQQMVANLLAKTNKTLEAFGGRYYLRHADSNQGFALEIEDTLLKNSRRLPKTLSGGESFVVSLALSLALAEMANNGQSIDSLFLDEGFGNLDADTLYQALTILESLKAQGKIVGIISHVEAVKKRIKTQIALTKKPNGLSVLSVV